MRSDARKRLNDACFAPAAIRLQTVEGVIEATTPVSIVGMVDRVTGKPATIYTPPEDLTPAPAAEQVRAAAEHVAALLRAIADEPIFPPLDRLTWRAAMGAAAAVILDDANARTAPR